MELAVRGRSSIRLLKGENVLDLFGGSGSTLIGCEQTGRKAFLMELDPLYTDVIVQRWERFTGRIAERRPAAADKRQGTMRHGGTSAPRKKAAAKPKAGRRKGVAP